MALSPDELEQIRSVVRSEIGQQREGFRLGYRSPIRWWMLPLVFLAVLALHVVVIGGFTVWHFLYHAH